MAVSLKNIIVPSIPLAVLLVVGCVSLWLADYSGTLFNLIPVQKATTPEISQSFYIQSPVIRTEICLAITLLNAFLIAQINNRFTIIRTRTFLPIVVFLILMGVWSQTHLIISSNLALTLFILALFNFFSMTRDKKSSEQAFLGSFLISLSSLFIHEYIYLIPVCWVEFIIFQSFSLRTFLASVFGVLAPWVIYISVSYYFDSTVDLSKIFNFNINFNFNYSTLNLSEYIYSGAIGLIMIISIFGIFSISNSDAIHTRNKLNFLLLLLFSFSILCVIFSQQKLFFLPFIAFSFSLLFSHPLTLKQVGFYGILFLVFCALNFSFVISKYILS